MLTTSSAQPILAISATTLLQILVCGTVVAQKPPLLPEAQVAALANELSGETAKRNLGVIATYHRQRGSSGFHAAAELVADRLRSYGLTDATILQFPADGKIFYGTQRSRPPWDAESAELMEIQRSEPPEKVPCSDAPGAGTCLKTVEHSLASYEAMPIVLAEDSESADVTADLVDVGDGTKESDSQPKMRGPKLC
jgi:aminopeptidase YwaD